MSAALTLRALAAAAALALPAMPTIAQAPATDGLPAAYHADTLVCLNGVTKVTCQVWLNVDGSYFAMFDRGPTDVAPMIGGIFRLEGREGRYTVRRTHSGTAICLAPDRVKGKVFQVERSDEMFGGSGCYPFEPGAEGTNWNGKDRKGREVRFWLVRDRG